MRSIAVAGIMAMSWACAAQGAAEKAAPLNVDTSWSLTLDAGGHVTDLVQQSEVKEPLAAPLAKAIRGWEFEPGKVDGQPAATNTTLYVRIELEPQGDGDAMRVDDVRTGGRIGKSRAPRFPGSLLRTLWNHEFAALAVVAVRYDKNGKVLAADAAADAPAVDEAVMRNAVAAVRYYWSFVPERVNGRGVAATVDVPICFRLSRNGRSGGPECDAWQPPGRRYGVDDGSAFTSAPAATLKSEVVSHVL